MTTYQPQSNATADLNFNSEIEALARLSCIAGKKQERRPPFYLESVEKLTLFPRQGA